MRIGTRASRIVFSLLLVLAAVAALSSNARADDWSDTKAVAVMNGRMYTVHPDGLMFSTSLSTGVGDQVGKADFANTRLLVAGQTNLYSIENDGTMYKISPVNGGWVAVGKAGSWKGALGMAFQNGSVYAVMPNGKLYRINPNTGAWQAVGNADFAATTRFFSTASALYSVENDGTLYWISPQNGTWKAIGTPGGWKGIIARATVENTLYTAHTSGSLFATNLTNGTVRTLAKTGYQKTKYLLTSAGWLYSLQATGITRIDGGTGASVRIGG